MKKDSEHTEPRIPATSRAGQSVYAHLLRDLVSGKLPPSGRLPTRRELIHHFKTTPVTVQRALDRLSEVGFIESRGKLGTFVADYPPNRHRVALVFKSAPTDSEWRQFWTVLQRAAATLQKGSHWQFESYYGIGSDAPDSDLARLCHDAAEHRLAGIFYASTPPMLPALMRLRPPAISVTTQEQKWLTAIAIDHVDFVRKAMDEFAIHGCRRIGLLAVPGYDDELLAAFRSLLTTHGMTCEERWIQLCHQSYPHWASNITELLFTLPSKSRPDGLLIADDNLTSDVCRGLTATGLIPGKDLRVVSHANFPADHSSGNAGVQRIGYDNLAILNHVLQVVEAHRLRQSAPSHIVIPACLEPQSISRRCSRHRN